MVRSRLGLKALGLCALMLGLMAFASVAQAETGAKWALIKKSDGKLVTISPTGDGKGIGDELLPEVQVKEIEVLPGTQEQHAVLLTTVSGLLVHILCTTATLSGVKLILLGALSNGSVVFEGCSLLIGSTKQGACTPHSAGSPEGTIASKKGTGLIKLHNGLPTVLISPETGEEFVKLVLGAEGESECSIGEFMPVSGKLSLEDGGGKSGFETEAPTHLIKEHAALTDLWVYNKTPEHKATIDGSAIIELAGEHKGFEWSGLPG